MNGIVYFNWFNMLNIFSGPRSHLSFGIDEFPAMSKRHTQDGHEDEGTNRVVGETWCLSYLHCPLRQRPEARRQSSNVVSKGRRYAPAWSTVDAHGSQQVHKEGDDAPNSGGSDTAGHMALNFFRIR